MAIRTKATNEWDRRGNKLKANSKKHISQKQIDEFVDRASTNLSFFAKYFCYREHSKAQRKTGKYLKEEKKVISVYSRQTGKTTIVGDYDVHELVFAEHPRGQEDFTMIFAPIQKQTALIYGNVTKILKGNKWLMSRVKKITGTKIIMKNGNSLTGQTASPGAHFRGFSPNKIQIDESQDITDVKYYEDILPSGATTDAKVQEIGTPAKRNHFWRTWNHDKSYKKVIQEWYKCPFIKRSYVEDCRQNMTQAKFDQEFNCIWNLDVGSAWNYEMIHKMCTRPKKSYSPEQGIDYYAGIDVGKYPAETVLSIAKAIGKTLKQILLLRISGRKSYSSILQKVYNPLIRFQPVTCIDATRGSPGEVLYDMLNAKLKDEKQMNMVYKLIPEHYNNDLKCQLVNDVDILGESHRLKLFNDPGQKRQLIAYEKKESKSGNIIYFSEELSDIVQADSLMVRAFVHHGMNKGGSFTYRTSGSTNMSNDGFSFSNQLPRDRPNW